MKSFKGNISKVQTICLTLKKETTLIFRSNIFLGGGGGGGATVFLATSLAMAMVRATMYLLRKRPYSLVHFVFPIHIM